MINLIVLLHIKDEVLLINILAKINDWGKPQHATFVAFKFVFGPNDSEDWNIIEFQLGSVDLGQSDIVQNPTEARQPVWNDLVMVPLKHFNMVTELLSRIVIGLRQVHCRSITLAARYVIYS